MSDAGITALLPIHNGAKYLPKLMNNLSTACAPQDEILVISDGSTDGTNEMITNWARRDARVRPILQKKIGLISTLNIGIDSASHHWIARFDADDTYAENRLMVQRTHIQKDVAAIFSDYNFQTTSHHSLGRVPSAITPVGVLASLSAGNRTAHPSVVFNKSIALHAGGYKQDDYKAEDLSLWIRMSDFGDLISVPELLVNYTLTKNSITRSNLDETRNARDRVLATYFKEVDLEFIWSSYEITKSTYSGIEMGDVRLFIHLLDVLRIASKVGASDEMKKNIRQELRSISASPLLEFSIGKMLFQKILRQIYLAT